MICNVFIEILGQYSTAFLINWSIFSDFYDFHLYFRSIFNDFHDINWYFRLIFTYFSILFLMIFNGLIQMFGQFLSVLCFLHICLHFFVIFDQFYAIFTYFWVYFSQFLMFDFFFVF